jgi:hypothetical protein
LRVLPDKDDGESVWIQALAQVMKRDGSIGYVLVEKDGRTGEDKVIKDFGSISIIGKFLEYYPITYLLPEFVPEFDNNKKESRMHYLRKKLGDLDYSQYTLKELNKMVINCAIGAQLAAMKSNK